ncbi:hypothetical protein F511_41704 [Dorcoceras hygrometricum]|uniref:Uncharacterized protein n=1 Tax=Dorcoceras hygrometricum TaxID=472368 RepID=A0A2Z7ADA2_9LAMI|nr:hypothetical protein F511_41704 [Dorcoceras hygrometricum]
MAAPAACTACGTLPHAARGTAGHRHYSCVQLQCCRAHATVPPCARYSAAVRTLQCRRLLRQSALEELTNLTRTESPRQGDRNKSEHGKRRQGGGGRGRRGGEGWAALGG